MFQQQGVLSPQTYNSNYSPNFIKQQQQLNIPNPENYNQHFNYMGTAFNPLGTPLIANGYDPTSGFLNHNFKNPKSLLHNNIDPNNILIEDIKEYSIYVDSKDRCVDTYPNPFKYKVAFKPLGKTSEIVNGVRHIYETPGPTVPENIPNIKYIRLEHIMLPYFYKVLDGKLNKNISLMDNLYFLLNINELHGENKYATNDPITKSFGVVYHDYNYNQTHFVGTTKNTKYNFPIDNLGKLNTLTISICDAFGNVFVPDHLDKKIKTCMGCTCDDDPDKCYFHSLNHPLNPVFQNHIHFKVGVVEPKFNKLNFS